MKRKNNINTKGVRRKVKFEISAGGIVSRKIGHNYQIAFLLDPYEKWTFAKGHLEKGESLEAAAEREVEEEMGLRNLKIINKLGKIDFWFRWRGKLIHKLVYYFLMEAPTHSKPKPQKKEGITKIKWVDINEAMDFCSYKNIKPLLKKAISKIKNN